MALLLFTIFLQPTEFFFQLFTLILNLTHTKKHPSLHIGKLLWLKNLKLCTRLIHGILFISLLVTMLLDPNGSTKSRPKLDGIIGHFKACSSRKITTIRTLPRVNESSPSFRWYPSSAHYLLWLGKMVIFLSPSLESILRSKKISQSMHLLVSKGLLDNIGEARGVFVHSHF